MIELESDEEFLLDLEAQIEGARRNLTAITTEFDQIAPGSNLSRSGRVETKHFISSIKHVLDQLTVRVWKTIVYPELPQEIGEKRLKEIYYPYAADEQMFRSSLGKMVDLKEMDAGTPTMRERIFADWLRATQPLYRADYQPFHTIGRLSRLPHNKLIDQRKKRLFALEAFSPNGGGVSLTFEDKPPSFTIWTYRDKHGVASTGIGSYPVTDDPDAELSVFTFDPETMDFNSIPGAKTSVSELMECRVEDLEFDALPLFQIALRSADQLVSESGYFVNSERWKLYDPNEGNAPNPTSD